MDDRPPPDPAKLLGQWNEWDRGETPPGRTMSNLKTGGLPDVLAAMDEDHPEITDPWDRWERGNLGPAAVLEALRDAGLPDLLARLSGAEQAAR
jgi:hypothetical protein